MGIKARILGISVIFALIAGAGTAAVMPYDSLAEAASRGDGDAVRSMLREGADVDATSADGATALFWAAYEDDLALMDLLIGAGADADTQNDYGATPLHVAGSNASAEAVEKLFDAGADPNVALPTGVTPLMEASRRGKADVVSLLLSHGADPKLSESNGGQTALMWALGENHTEVVRLLVEHGADVNAPSGGDFTPLMFAAQQGNADTAQLLLDAGADPNAAYPPSGMTPLLIASVSGHAQIVPVLLDGGADPDVTDKDGFMALHYAAENKEAVPILHSLLLHGADANARLVQNRPTHFDNDAGGVRIEQTGATPLLLAAEVNNIDAVMALVDAGADPTVTTDIGTTTLILASGAGVDVARPRPPEEQAVAIDTARYLVGLGADVNAAGQYGWTAAHAAAYHSYDDVIAFLASEGADLDAMDDFGQTPLSIALTIITEGLGTHYSQAPRVFRRETADLLLSLGATPLEESGVLRLTQRANE